jgi:hypothetical protein
MTNLNEIIIIGGGTSIEPEIKRLEPVLAHKCTILTNYSYKHFPGTFLTFLDREFYVPDYAKNYADEHAIRHPDIYKELSNLPLIVGINDNGIEEFKLNNTILLNKKCRENLTGVFALKLAETILESGKIFCLGFDWNRRIGLPPRDPNYTPHSDLQIHYYNDIKHRGIGYVGYYENHNPDKEFSRFIKKDIKIYNVSLESNIRSFEKISYEQFYELLTKKSLNQEELRKFIKNKLIIKEE